MKFTQTIIPNSIKVEMAIEEVLEDFRSPYQRVRVLQSKHMGKLLVLDDEIQFAEFDEFVYHEMFCFPPLLSHPGDPRSVLIIGGGDLLLAKQVLKLPTIQSVEVVEIDSAVVEVCKKHFKHLLKDVISNPKLHIINQDGFKFVSNSTEKYDLVYVDLTIPKEISQPLYSRKFYEKVKKILNDNGIVAAQSDYGSYYWYDQMEDTIKLVSSLLNMKDSFLILRFFEPSFKYLLQYSQFIPSFFVCWSFTIGSDVDIWRVSLSDIKKKYQLLEPDDLLIYSPEYHQHIYLQPKILQNLFSRLNYDK